MSRASPRSPRRAVHRTFATAAATIAAPAALTGCGGGGDDRGAGFPAAQAADIEGRLDEVLRRVRSGAAGNLGACEDLSADSFPAIDELLEGLPPNLDKDLRDALVDGIERLKELADQQCEEARRRREQTTPEPTETTPTDTETEEPTPTEPPTTQTEPDTDTQTETEAEPRPKPKPPETPKPPKKPRPSDPSDGGGGDSGGGDDTGGVSPNQRRAP